MEKPCIKESILTEKRIEFFQEGCDEFRNKKETTWFRKHVQTVGPFVASRASGGRTAPGLARKEEPSVQGTERKWSGG